MFSLNRNLIIDPGTWVKKTPAGIDVPEIFRKPVNIGKVFADVQGSSLRKGDWVAYHLENAWNINGNEYKYINIDDRVMIQAHESQVQCVLIPKTDMAKKTLQDIYSGRKAGIEINYETDIQMLYYKVAIKISKDNYNRQTANTGLVLPDMAIGRNSVIGEVLSLGAKANEMFHEDELKVGDEVLIPKNPSGGYLPLGDGKEIWRCNSHELVAKKVDGEWVPIGGRAIVEVFPLGMVKKWEVHTNPFSGITYEQEVYLPAGETDAMIATPAKMMNQCRTYYVHSTGKGWGEKNDTARGVMQHGPLVFKSGDVVVGDRILTDEGETAHEVEEIDVSPDGKRKHLRYIVPAKYFISIVNNEKVKALSREKYEDVPETVILSEIGKMGEKLR